ncbi:MAG: hypothetical protein ACOX08_00505 [Methanobacterium sp.]
MIIPVLDIKNGIAVSGKSGNGMNTSPKNSLQFLFRSSKDFRST